MKKAKLVKNNKKQVEIEKDSYSLKNLLLIILVLVITFGIFYFITTLVIDPIEESSTNNTATQVDSTKIILNNLLDRKNKEYYVLATKENKNTQVNYQGLYNDYISKYTSEKDSLTFYYVDLDDALNKNYISEELNISDEISEIKLNVDVLFKVKNNKIKEYFVGSSDILEALSNLKES